MALRSRGNAKDENSSGPVRAGREGNARRPVVVLRRWVEKVRWEGVLAVGAACAALAAAIFNIFQASNWSKVTAAGCIFAVAILIVWHKSCARRSEEALAQAQAVEAAESEARARSKIAASALRCWPLPVAADADPSELGVAASSTEKVRSGSAVQKLLPYISRDVDEKCRETLRQSNRLLLVGIPGSGLTRTAYELTRGLEDGTEVLAPRAPDGLRVAVDELQLLSRSPHKRRILLWLDRIDEFSQSGLSVEIIRRIARENRSLQVIATISSVAFETWGTTHPQLSDEFGESVLLQRVMSERERADAKLKYPDLDLTYGLAAALTSKAAFLRRLRGGNPACSYDAKGEDCPAVRNLLGSMARWVATGTSRPMPRDRLSTIDEAGDCGHSQEATAWALQATRGGPPLMFEAGDSRLQLHPEARALMLDDAESPTAEDWSQALTDAIVGGESDEVGRIGLRASIAGCNVVAERAWSQISSTKQPGAEFLNDAAKFNIWTGGAFQALHHLTRINSNDFGRPSDKWAEAAAREASAIWAHYRSDEVDVLLQECLRHYETTNRDNPALTTVLGTRASIAMANEVVPTGEILTWLRRAVAIAQLDQEKQASSRARALTNLGRGYLYSGDLAQAKTALEAAYRLAEDNPHDILSVHRAYAISAYGDLLRTSFALTQSVAAFQQALALAARSRDIQTDSLVYSYAMTLANLYGHLQNEDEMRKVSEIAAKKHAALGEFTGQQSELTDAREMLAAKKHVEAKSLVDAALPKLIERYGPTHSSVAAAHAIRARAWCVSGRPLEAIPDHEAAIEIQRKGPAAGTRGISHHTVYAMVQLGKEWEHAGVPARATETYRRALDEARQVFPGRCAWIVELEWRLRALTLGAATAPSAPVIEIERRRAD